MNIVERRIYNEGYRYDPVTFRFSKDGNDVNSTIFTDIRYLSKPITPILKKSVCMTADATIPRLIHACEGAEIPFLDFAKVWLSVLGIPIKKYMYEQPIKLSDMYAMLRARNIDVITYRERYTRQVDEKPRLGTRYVTYIQNYELSDTAKRILEDLNKENEGN